MLTRKAGIVTFKQEVGRICFWDSAFVRIAGPINIEGVFQRNKISGTFHCGLDGFSSSRFRWWLSGTALQRDRFILNNIPEKLEKPKSSEKSPTWGEAYGKLFSFCYEKVTGPKNKKIPITYSEYSCSCKSAKWYPKNPKTSPQKNLMPFSLEIRLILISWLCVHFVAHITSKLWKYSSGFESTFSVSAVTDTIGLRFFVLERDDSAL